MMIRHTLDELIALKEQGHRDTIDAGYTTIDLPAVEAEIAKREIEANISALEFAWRNVDV